MEKIVQHRYEIVSMYLNNQTLENWNKLVDYIRKYNLGQKQKLTIPFSEGDVQEMMSGEEFNWSFETDKGEEIEINIVHEEVECEDEEEEEEEEDGGLLDEMEYRLK